MRTHKKICHYPFVMLGCTRQLLLQLLHIWEINFLWLSVIAMEWEITFKTSAWYVVHNFIHLSFVRELLHKTTKIAQLQKFNQLNGKPTLQFFNIVITTHWLLVSPIWSAPSEYQHIRNKIYLISYLFSIWMILLNMNFYWD